MPSSLTERVALALRAPVRSYEAERAAGLAERRLVAIAFGATLFLTLGRVMAETVRPELAIGEERAAWFAATLLIGFSFGVLGLYGAAALVRMICRLFRGGGGWAETRLALFWSGLAAGPFVAVGYIAGAMFGGASLAGLVGGVAWAILFIPMIAAAHGFAIWKTATIFLTACVVLRVIGELT